MRRKCVLVALALLFTTSAAMAQPRADWALLGSNPSGHRLYVDRQHTVTRGKVVRLWILYDYPDLQGDPPVDKQYRSVALHEEIHCANRTIRSLAVRLYAENLGRGRLVLSTDLDNAAPEHPPLGSGRQQEIDAGCRNARPGPFAPPRPSKPAPIAVA